MASRIIHICIADKLAKIHNLNYRCFLLGSIAPDAHYPNLPPHVGSHFALPEEKRKVNNFIDYPIFIHKYLNNNRNDFFLGYYCHLISDEIWYSDIYTKYILANNENDILSRMELVYRDYRRLNGKVIQYYCINDLSNISLDLLDGLRMEEIDLTAFENILEEAKTDFNYGMESNEPLELLEFEEITNYINKAVCECSAAIKKYL
ncbi:zinc dependent phospholipase C family protein [Clostridium tagluense]|uniref:zinc dependent phospholipase C family protein n=1 Tax=Clostridium tagluense TaxID=360422 RepID=UPI001CF3A6CF|nr:zinc dependent phospholipase C family protein [Clostridium tagluense]MCB2296194.1 zinc dependent phospholipase C family protein [Clostridium tagluense]